MKNVFSISAGLLLTLSLLAGTALADGTTNCQTIYGGGQNCVTTNISINKTVLVPGSDTKGSNGNFVDNLGVNDPKFAPGQIIKFNLDTTNTGNSNLSNITVKDIFPQFVQFIPGAGQENFDANTKTLTLPIGSLSPNQSKTVTLIGKIVPSNELPSDQGIICAINQATATDNVGDTASDNSQFCIQQPTPVATKGGLTVFPPPQVTATPPTGPETLPLVGLIASGALGLFFNRKSVSKIKFKMRGGEKI